MGGINDFLKAVTEQDVRFKKKADENNTYKRIYRKEVKLARHMVRTLDRDMNNWVKNNEIYLNPRTSYLIRKEKDKIDKKREKVRTQMNFINFD